MKRVCRALCAIALSFVTAVASVRRRAQTLEEIQRDVPPSLVDGVVSYLYGYPLMMFGVTGRTGTTVPDFFRVSVAKGRWLAL
jgi:hypothetical protein